MSVGSTTVADRSAQRARGPSAWRRSLLAAVLVLALPLVAGAHDLEPLRTPGAKNLFREVQAAFAARDAKGVVAAVRAKGWVTLQLRNPSVSGTMRRAQAERALQQYFEGVSEVKLVDKTPRRSRGPKHVLTRLYHYTYQARGHDAVTTRLSIMMQGDARGNWGLASIKETPLDDGR